MCKNRIMLCLLCARSTCRRCNEGESSEVHNLLEFASIFGGIKATSESYSTLLQCYFLTGKRVEATSVLRAATMNKLLTWSHSENRLSLYNFHQPMHARLFKVDHIVRRIKEKLL